MGDNELPKPQVSPGVVADCSEPADTQKVSASQQLETVTRTMQALPTERTSDYTTRWNPQEDKGRRSHRDRLANDDGVTATDAPPSTRHFSLRPRATPISRGACVDNELPKPQVSPGVVADCS